MSHHNPMELDIFKTETRVTEDNQLFRMMLWKASILRMYSDWNSAYHLFFPLLHIKQVENQKKKRVQVLETAANWKNTLFECSALWLLPKMLIVSRRTHETIHWGLPHSPSNKENQEDCDVMGSQHKPVWKGENGPQLWLSFTTLFTSKWASLGHNHVSVKEHYLGESFLLVLYVSVCHHMRNPQWHPSSKDLM